MYGDRGFRPKPSPVRVDDELEVTIEAVGKKGDGIAKKDGFVLFISNVRKGDQVKVRVTKVLKNVGFAEVVGGTAVKRSNSEESDEGGEGSGESSEEAEKSGDESESEEEEESFEDSEDFGEE